MHAFDRHQPIAPATHRAWLPCGSKGRKAVVLEVPL